MKLLFNFLTIAFLLITVIVKGQWQPSSTTAGTIYYNGGNVGIGTSLPKAKLDVGFLANGALSTVLGRFAEGDASGDGTFLGVRNYTTQGDFDKGIKSFAIEHSFYGSVNSSINFYRGSAILGGFITFCTSENTERMRINAIGNVGIGTNPNYKLDVNGTIYSSTDGWSVFAKTSSNSAYGLVASGASGSARHIFTANQEGYSNGFTVDYTGTEMIYKFRDGNVGIGTDNPTQKLAVNGTIRCKEVLVEATPWPDYVFAKGYKLRTLSELEAFIKANNHLPEMPTAADAEQNGVKLSELNTKLLQKVEELTLYLIEQNKKLEMVIEENNKLKQSDAEMKKRLEIVETLNK
jgi:hypothetical protein